MGKSSDGFDVPWPAQSEKDEDGNYTRSYQVSLNVNGQEGTLLDSFYKEHGSNPDDPYYSILHPIITIKSPNELQYIKETSEEHKSNKSKADIDTEINSGD
jgi:hypothetical protein